MTIAPATINSFRIRMQSTSERNRLALLIQLAFPVFFALSDGQEHMFACSINPTSHHHSFYVIMLLAAEHNSFALLFQPAFPGFLTLSG